MSPYIPQCSHGFILGGEEAGGGVHFWDRLGGLGFRFQHGIQSSDVHIKWGLHLSMQARVVIVVIMVYNGNNSNKSNRNNSHISSYSNN